MKYVHLEGGGVVQLKAYWPIWRAISSLKNTIRMLVPRRNGVSAKSVSARTVGGLKLRNLSVHTL